MGLHRAQPGVRAPRETALRKVISFFILTLLIVTILVISADFVPKPIVTAHIKNGLR